MARDPSPDSGGSSRNSMKITWVMSTPGSNYVKSKRILEWLKHTFNIKAYRRLLKAELSKFIPDKLEEMSNVIYELAKEPAKFEAKLDNARKIPEKIVNKFAQVLADRNK